MATTCLVTVVVGRDYERFARQLFASAAQYFKPTEKVRFETLPGVAGWPQATITRPAILAEWLFSEGADGSDFVFLIDADARFEQDVGPEVLPDEGIAATLHPGYVGKSGVELPYERNPASACAIFGNEKGRYFCGGFVGGERFSFMKLMSHSAMLIEQDASIGYVPCWHDESALNRVLADSPPEKVLTPAYAHPDDDSWYRSWWPELYERKVVMLDKKPSERARRHGK